MKLLNGVEQIAAELRGSTDLTVSGGATVPSGTGVAAATVPHNT